MSVLVSVIIPCFNEVRYIEKCLDSILLQGDMVGEIEILVVDGRSNDGTRDILKGFEKKHSNIKMIDNPGKVTPIALNLGIKNSKGKFICIMGAHAEYQKDFLYNCVNLLNNNNEFDCVGGPIISLGINFFSKATAIAMSSFIGVGNAKHRFPDYEGEAEMACFPMFRKEVFEKIGYYDETLIKNQDDEFCFRLRLNGGKIFISPKVKSSYYVRDSISRLFRQYFEYGRWRIAVLKKHKEPISYRQQIPAAFYMLMILLLLSGIIIKNFFLALFLPVLYLSVLLFYSFSLFRKEKFKVLILIPVSAVTLHFSYALGFIRGLLSFGKT